MGLVKGRERGFMERHIGKEMQGLKYREIAMPS